MDIKSQYNKLQKYRKKLVIKKLSYNAYKENYIIHSDQKPSIAIIIPFREHSNSNVRKNQLKKLIKHLNSFFKKQNVKHSFYVVKQNSYSQRFNRGKLLNIGFEIAKKDKCNIFVTHDVDMLPDNSLLKFYLHIPKYPLHIAYPGSSTKYEYSKYLGGINIYNSNDYEKINGFPNDFWGWGGEDDAIYDRLAINNIKVIRPIHGKIKELPHENLKENKEHVNLKKWENRIANIKNWNKNGISNLKYKITKTKKVSMVNIINVNI